MPTTSQLWAESGSIRPRAPAGASFDLDFVRFAHTSCTLRAVHADARVDLSLVPIGDGLTLARRR